ncbi:MAG: NAD(P)/FAD-dependent oxidoreductase [Candidatus Hydrothermarchaeales archaeon]
MASVEKDEEYDVVVIGAGPGGLTAGIWCAERGLKVLILEGGSVGGLSITLFPEKLIPNYPGFSDGVLAKDLVKDWLKKSQDAMVEIRKERVVEITPEKIVKTTEGEYRSKIVIIATGNRPKELGVPGEADFNTLDKGVYYYMTDPGIFEGKKVLVVGGGDTAVDAALDLKDTAEEITIIHRRGQFRALPKNVKKMQMEGKIRILLNTELVEITGDEEVEGVVLKDNKKDRFDLAVDKVVLAVGMTPNNEIFEKLGLKTDDKGLIVTDNAQRTSIKGIYAVGDISSASGGFELIIAAVAQGAIAACHVFLETMQPYWAG